VQDSALLQGKSRLLTLFQSASHARALGIFWYNVIAVDRLCGMVVLHGVCHRMAIKKTTQNPDGVVREAMPDMLPCNAK